MVHEEDLELSSGGAMNEGPVATRLGVPGFPRPPRSPWSRATWCSSRRRVAVCTWPMSRAKGSVRAIRAAKARGLKVTCEVAPHHFSLTDAAVETYSTHAKMMPPLRAEADRQALWVGMADGTIDAIATDHAPHSPVEEDVELDRAANGVVGLETALPLTLELVRSGTLTATRAIRAAHPRASCRPGHAPGDARRGAPASTRRYSRPRALLDGRGLALPLPEPEHAL